MPNAIPFTALGGGNGFSGCLSKVDVSSSANWCTLSGLSSGPASDESINASLRAAMQFFWNAKEMYAVGSFNAGESSSDPEGFSYRTLATLANANPVDKEPIERVCVNNIATGTKRAVDATAPTLLAARVNITFNPRIIRMYNGSTANEDNFVGYGIDGDMSVDCGAFGTVAQVSIVSYTNATNIGTSTVSQSVGKTTINTPSESITIICIARAESAESGTFGEPPDTTTVVSSRSASASGRFASMSESITRIDTELDEDGEEFQVTTRSFASGSVSINQIVFYTY